MSTIIFEGNTYTFGATVSANPGTGTTSYIFGGLDSGQSYGFIIWAFNSFGPSTIVGPVNYSTLSQATPESREMIGAFAYAWGTPNTSAYPALVYDSGSTTNLFIDTENMSSTWWGPPASVTRTKSGETLPNGLTNGIIFTTPAIFNYYDIAQLPDFLEGGATYVHSWYMNETLGSGYIYYNLYFVAGSNLPKRRQLLPVEGMTWNTDSTIMRNPALTGWVRYAFEFETSSFGPSNNSRGLYYVPSLRTPNIAGVRNYYIGSPQLEKKLS